MRIWWWVARELWKKGTKGVFSRMKGPRTLTPVDHGKHGQFLRRDLFLATSGKKGLHFPHLTVSWKQIETREKRGGSLKKLEKIFPSVLFFCFFQRFIDFPVAKNKILVAIKKRFNLVLKFRLRKGNNANIFFPGESRRVTPIHFGSEWPNSARRNFQIFQENHSCDK